LLNACKTYDYFSINVLEPGDLAFPPGLKKVVISHNLFRSAADTAGTIYTLFDQIKQDTTYLYDEIASEAIFNLQDFLNASGRFEAVIEDSIHHHFPKKTDDFTMNDLDLIRQVCEKNNAGAFILLDKLDSFDQYNVISDQVVGYFGEFKVIMSTSWLFINPFSAKINDSKTVTDTFYYQTDPWYFNEGVKELPFRKDVLVKAGGESGIIYGKRISPFWSETDRLIFINGCKEIKKGYRESLQGNWTDAASYWQQALNNTYLLNRAKAAFNLGLACEMDGLLKPAIEWVQKSIDMLPDTINKTYKVILEKRLAQQDDILWQMEGKSN